MNVREKLERAQKTAAEQVTKTQFGAYRRLDKAITEVLAELDEVEREYDSEGICNHEYRHQSGILIGGEPTCRECAGSWFGGDSDSGGR